MYAGNIPAAINVLRALPPSDRQARPVTAAILRPYGRSHLARDTASALAIRRGAVDWFPVSHAAHMELATGLLAIGDTTGALRHLDRSLSITPNNAEPRELRTRLRAARAPGPATRPDRRLSA